MAEVYASPGLLKKRSYLEGNDGCDSNMTDGATPSFGQPSACKRRRSFGEDLSTRNTPAGFTEMHNGWNASRMNAPLPVGMNFGEMGRNAFTMGGGGGGGGLTTDLPTRGVDSTTSMMSMGVGGTKRSHPDSDQQHLRGPVAAVADSVHRGSGDAVEKLKSEFTAILMKKEEELRAVTQENTNLRQAIAHAQVEHARMDGENKILKKGLNIQNSKMTKYEEELTQLRHTIRQALDKVHHLEQANRGLCLRILQAGGAGIACNDFINHQPPPDVF